MSNFHYFLHKFTLGFFIFSFVVVANYIPQPIHKVNYAEATLVEDVVSWVNQGYQLVKQTAMAAWDKVVAFVQNSLHTKEFSLDGLAWHIAKAAVSQMMRATINWVNSGFNGQPAFMQDLKGEMLKAGNMALENYLTELGSPGGWMCDAFALDVGFLINFQYPTSEPTRTSCSLNDKLANLSGFVEGDFIQGGGWDTWFEVVGNPGQNTGPGTYLTVKAEVDSTIAEAKANKQETISMAGGFLSQEVCEDVEVSTSVGIGTVKKCEIITPGKTISNAVSNKLGLGDESLIAADEIDELIGSLMTQISQRAFSGGGLLGLTKGDPSRPNDPPVLGGGNDGDFPPGFNPDEFLTTLNNSLRAEQLFLDGTTEYLPRLNAYAAGRSETPPFLILNYPPTTMAQATEQASLMFSLVNDINANITDIQSLIADLNALLPQRGSATFAENFNRIVQRYSSMSSRLHSETEVTSTINEWASIVNTPPLP